MPKKGAARQPDLFLIDTLSGPRFDKCERTDVVRQLQMLLRESVTARATEVSDDADNT